MLSWGDCPACGQGKIGYRRCSGSDTVVLLCEECALVWMHPAKVSAETAQDPLAPEFGRRHPGVELRNSRWATEQDIEVVGWSAYLLKVADILPEIPTENS